MPVKIRLQRHGSKKKPFYFIVVANATAPRDGKYIEKIGTYDPISDPAKIIINRDKATLWLGRGAQPTPTTKRILSFKGVLFWKHLLRGVKLGLFDLDAAHKQFEEWEQKHDSYVVQKKSDKSEKERQKQAAIDNAVSERAKAKQAEKLAERNEAPSVVAELQKEEGNEEENTPETPAS